jgi:hypothetical protein
VKGTWKSSNLGHLFVDAIARSGSLQEILGRVYGQLIIFGPLADLVEVFASVARVEVGVGLRVVWVDPDLAEDTGVGCAHELLSEYIETVS